MLTPEMLTPGQVAYLRECAALRVAQDVRDGRVRASEASEVRDELVCRVLRRLHTFDPLRASVRTFIARLTAWEAGGLRRQPQKRRRERTLPARQVVRCRIEQEERGLADRLGAGRRSGESGGPLDLVLDVREAVARLPRDLRRVCTLLMEHSAAESRRLMGWSRRRFENAVAIIRVRFAVAGLRVYFA